MSTISGALAQALGAVSAALGETLQYRTAHGGIWAALTGFVLDRDDPAPPLTVEYDQAEDSVHTGRLSGPLTPAFAIGYEVLDGNGDTWAVDAPPDFDQQQIITLRRTTVDNAGPNRGGAS